MKRWKIWGMALLLIIMTALTACGSSQSNEGAGNGGSGQPAENAGGEGQKQWSGTVRVLYIGDYKKEDSTDPVTGIKRKGLNVLKEEFEKTHPGAKVEMTIIPWDNYVAKTQAMLAGGEADVYQMPGIADFAAQGLLEPLQPFIDKDNFDLSTFIDKQVDGWLAMGPEDTEPQIYGLPGDGDTRFIAYDKQLFEEWGVEPLSDHPTMDEILEKAKKMTGTNPKTGKQNYGVWFRGDWSTAFTLVNAAEAQNGSWGSGFKWEEIQLAFDSPEMVNGLKWLLELKKYAPEGIVSNQGQEKWLTPDNNIAIMLNQGPGDNLRQIYANGLQDRVFFVQEFNNDEGVGGLFAGSPFTIAKNAQNKELAWEYIKFIASDFHQKFMFEEWGRIPVVKSAENWDSVKEIETHMVPILEALSTPVTPRYPWASSQPRFILQAKIEAALTGQLTPEEALKQAQQESTTWIKER